MVDIYCEICHEKIAQADLDTMRAPMRGSMFFSPDPFHDFPAPFPPEATWEDMKCPICQHRPFIHEGRVSVKVMDKDEHEVVESDKLEGDPVEGAKLYTCLVCNRTFNRPAGLASHMRSHAE